MNQSVRELESLSSVSISEDSGRTARDSDMLKHIRTTVKSTSSGGGNPHNNKPSVQVSTTSLEKAKTNGKTENIPAAVDDKETQLPLPQVQLKDSFE